MIRVFLALLRIRRPEALEQHAPPELGRLLGLDRAPEVKTLRRKLARLAGRGRATEFGRLLATGRVQHVGDAMGFLCVDSHVRAYHGKRELPKTHVGAHADRDAGDHDYWLCAELDALAPASRLPVCASATPSGLRKRTLCPPGRSGGLESDIHLQRVSNHIDCSI